MILAPPDRTNWGWDGDRLRQEINVGPPGGGVRLLREMRKPPEEGGPENHSRGCKERRGQASQK